MKILVTGGCGFIGSSTVDALIKKGHEVIVVDNLSSGDIKNLNKNVKFYQEDIKSKNLKNILLKELPQIVYHFAAQINVPLSLKDPIYDLKNNIEGTVNLLESFKDCNIEKIIYPSSAAIYGEPKYLPLDELHVKDPISFYGISKLAPEYYIKVFSNIYKFKYTILRYSNIYGARQNNKGEGGVVSAFIDSLIENKQPIIFDNGEQTRDFIYIKDVVDSNLEVIDKGNNEILNVSSGISTTINTIFYEIRNLLKSCIEPKYISKRKEDIKHSLLKNNKIKEIVGWSPKYSLQEGLKETINYYINNNLN